MLTKDVTKKIYLNIKDGAIVWRTPIGGEERFSYVSGTIEAIYQRERTFNDKTVIYWYINLIDKKANELYSIGFPYQSNVFKSIILQLASEAGAAAIRKGETIRIEPYKKNDRVKVQLFNINSGERFSWITRDLPQEPERMNFIDNLAKELSFIITNRKKKSLY